LSDETSAASAVIARRTTMDMVILPVARMERSEIRGGATKPHRLSRISP